MVVVVRHPHRQQAVLEGDAEVPGVGRLDPLVVAADVAADQVVDRRLHELLRDHQPLPQIDRVPLGLQPGEERVLERLQLAGVPWLQSVDQVRRDALRSAHEHVVEEVLHLAGDGVPVRPRDGVTSAPRYRWRPSRCSTRSPGSRPLASRGTSCTSSRRTSSTGCTRRRVDRGWRRSSVRSGRTKALRAMS